MENKFYVYAHQRLDDNSIFYIGKGHGKRAWVEQHRSKYWKNIVNKAGYNVLILQDGMTETDSFILEKYLIVFYGRADLGEGRLVNMTDGADGSSGRITTEVARNKVATANKGRICSEERRQKISKANKGRKWFNDGTNTFLIKPEDALPHYIKGRL